MCEVVSESGGSPDSVSGTFQRVQYSVLKEYSAMWDNAAFLAYGTERIQSTGFLEAQTVSPCTV